MVLRWVVGFVRLVVVGLRLGLVGLRLLALFFIRDAISSTEFRGRRLILLARVIGRLAGRLVRGVDLPVGAGTGLRVRRLGTAIIVQNTL